MGNHAENTESRLDAQQEKSAEDYLTFVEQVLRFLDQRRLMRPNGPRTRGDGALKDSD